MVNTSTRIRGLRLNNVFDQSVCSSSEVRRSDKFNKSDVSDRLRSSFHLHFRRIHIHFRVPRRPEKKNGEATAGAWACLMPTHGMARSYVRGPTVGLGALRCVHHRSFCDWKISSLCASSFWKGAYMSAVFSVAGRLGIAPLWCNTLRAQPG